MISTANLTELKALIGSSHGDPHHILGLHEISIKTENEDRRAWVVRAFVPQAERVFLLDPLRPDYSEELTRIHDDGFFEKALDGCSGWFRYKLKFMGYGSEWENYDPYSFAPVLGELDLHLFGEGTHYSIFDKLGAHPMEVDGVSGVLFAVWAPNAKRVSVIGDFNNWDGRRCQMRILGSSGVWELFVPGVEPLDRYKYEIKTVNGELLQKSDPYGCFAELRPSTSSLVFDLSGYKWRDGKWRKGAEENNPLDGPINIYEAHLGSWRYNQAENRFLSYPELAEAMIPYVKKMGYTHIELMPIEEHPFDGSWGYQVTGYYAPTSRYGNPAEFMAFVDKCHQNGIGVILDWVPAHFPKDAHGLARFDGSALYEHQDPRLGEHPDWGTLIFNFGRNEVKNFLIANAIYWIERFHIDGLRVDAVASMLYLDYGKSEGGWIPNKYGGNENLDAVEFMKHMNSVILGKHPHALMIAEESTAWAGVSRPVRQNGLGFNLKWNMGWMNDFLAYVKEDPLFRRYLHNKLTFGMVYAYTENFVLVLSHDEVVHGKRSMLDKMPGDIWQKFANLRAAYGFMYGHPGKKLLFMGGEFGHFAEWSEKRELDWFLLEYDTHAGLQKYVRDLNLLYKRERACWYDDFTGGGFSWINCDDSFRSTFSFVRNTDDKLETLLFITNFTPVAFENYDVGAPFPGIYREILNSDAAKYGGSGVVNKPPLKTAGRECDGRRDRLTLRVPPLGTVILKYQGE